MKIIECPRDAMQGIHEFIDTDKKAEYINQLLKVGFDTIDFGSFVSPKAIPQLRDTAEVLSKLNPATTKSKLLAIIANVRGAEDAASFQEIDYLGFPLSVSETFQQRNTNKSIEQALEQLAQIQNICISSGKKLVTYLSMGFGNPYGDSYSPEILKEFVEKLDRLGILIISLADTIGAADQSVIKPIFEELIKAYPHVEFGAHFHSHPNQVAEKILSAYTAGCRRFDGAIKGYGGCPMAEDELVGNIPTEQIIALLEEEGENLSLDREAFQESMLLAGAVFPE